MATSRELDSTSIVNIQFLERTNITLINQSREQKQRLTVEFNGENFEFILNGDSPIPKDFFDAFSSESHLLEKEPICNVSHYEVVESGNAPKINALVQKCLSFIESQRCMEDFAERGITFLELPDETTELFSQTYVEAKCKVELAFRELCTHLLQSNIPNIHNQIIGVVREKLQHSLARIDVIVEMQEIKKIVKF
ncbi:hypothetical protein D5018_20280 [Parashewanella curva]|uniref:Uncharacterized protein n=1 Tax=Parashewanella curva TaxID=2338552 RepID=A0A3L8PR46_9GAMM|nr:hypothetical protein [Parashewanella curva]RLV57861.1 hypothetical protein D5018_20280 [Parashewanella curva]